MGAKERTAFPLSASIGTPSFSYSSSPARSSGSRKFLWSEASRFPPSRRRSKSAARRHQFLAIRVGRKGLARIELYR